MVNCYQKIIISAVQVTKKRIVNTVLRRDYGGGYLTPGHRQQQLAIILLKAAEAKMVLNSVTGLYNKPARSLVKASWKFSISTPS